MTILSRSQVPLCDAEIRLIKGLLRRRRSLNLNQQRIIAYFSFPERTVHHNIISAIARGQVCASDVDYPPADIATCKRFIANSTGQWDEHRWTMLYSVQPQTDKFRFSYRYHSVGQGLFCSGCFTRQGRTPFRWVYDCGTEQGSRNPKRGDRVRAEIATLERDQGSSHLDLVTLSHFDEDHLSGILDLLETFSVGTLLLPYLTPWERLIVLLSERIEMDSDLFGFLIAPTAFLLERAGDHIERILLVPPGGDGPALPPLFSPDEPRPEYEIVESAPDPLIKDEKPAPENGNESIGADKGLSDSRVRMLHRGGSIVVAHAWEFVPYNDTRLEALATSSFKNAAKPLARQLTQAKGKKTRQAALTTLTQLYDNTFKSPGSKKISARRRNEISLFLYAGPIGRVCLTEARATIPRYGMSPNSGDTPHLWLRPDRFGQMFTGDGFLHTPKQWADFKTFYSSGNRLYRGAIFQVMHHGSKANWQSGLAAQIQPVASLFCSDPLGSNGHPSPEVVADFANFHPLQVDGVHGWMLEGEFHFF